MGPSRLSAAGARRFLVVRHQLAPARSQVAGLDGVRAVFARLGSIQFDPLAVAGRNHDLVLHARVRDYEPAWTNQLLYGERELFEAYNKGLSLLPTSELPWHRHTWDEFERHHADGAFARHRQTMEHVLERIRKEGPLCSLDFERKPAVDWYWGPTSEVRAVLEALAEAGVIALHRREGNRRYYDLTERLFPPAILGAERPEREQRRHRLLSRYRAHGLLGEGGQSELWYGIGPARTTAKDPPGTISRSELRRELVEAGELVPVTVEGLRGPRYVLAADPEREKKTSYSPQNPAAAARLRPVGRRRDRFVAVSSVAGQLEPTRPTCPRAHFGPECASRRLRRDEPPQRKAFVPGSSASAAA